MISIIQGTVKAIETTSIHVLTNSGLGYELSMPLPSLHQLSTDSPVMLWTVLVVREDAQILCGFLQKQERDTFQILIKISGVGVRMALAILSVLPPDELSAVIEQGDEVRLTKIAGVGKKTAQRLLIELNGKLDGTGSGYADTLPNTSKDTELALLSLGYKPKEIEHAIKTATQLGVSNTDELIRACLKLLSHH